MRLLHSAKRVRISTYCYNFAYNLCAVVPGGVGGGGGLARLDDGGGGGVKSGKRIKSKRRKQLFNSMGFLNFLF